MNEYFDVLNSNGEYTNEVASREECHKKGLYHKAVVVFILNEDNTKNGIFKFFINYLIEINDDEI